MTLRVRPISSADAADGRIVLPRAVTAPKATRRAQGFATDLGRLVVDDCLAVLRGMPAESVDLVITSPPTTASRSTETVSGTSGSGIKNFS